MRVKKACALKAYAFKSVRVKKRAGHKLTLFSRFVSEFGQKLSEDAKLMVTFSVSNVNGVLTEYPSRFDVIRPMATMT